MAKIVIDPGHGGKDGGATSINGLKEKDVNLKISHMLAGILISYGINVVFTRCNDEYVSLDERVKMTNDSNADYFVSVHCNSSSNKNANGTEVFAYSKQSEGSILAKNILDSLIEKTGLSSRGIKYDKLQVVASTNIPACLVEVAFLSNSKEEKLLRDNKFLLEVSEGIAQGILKHLNIEWKDKMSKIRIKLHDKYYEVDGFFKNNTNFIYARFLEKMGYKLSWENGVVVIKYNV